MANKPMQYLIELIADDSKLKQQLRGIDWSKELGDQSKEFVALLSDATEEGRKKMVNILRGLNIDWASVLGVNNIKAAIDDAVSGLRDELGRKIEIRADVSELKALSDRMVKLEGLLDHIQSTKITVDVGVNTTDVEKVAKRVQTAMAKIKVDMGSIASLDEYRQTLKELLEMQNELVDYDFSGLDFDKLEEKLNAAEDKMLELEKVFNALNTPGKMKSADISRVQKELLLVKHEYLAIVDEMNAKMESMPGYEIDLEDSRKIAKDFVNEISKDFDELRRKIKEVTSEIQSSLKNSLAKAIKDQLSEIPLTLTLDDEHTDELVQSINDYIKKLNQQPLETIRLKIDSALDVSDKEVFGTKEFNQDKKNIEDSIKLVEDRLVELRTKQQKLKDEFQTSPSNVKSGEINKVTKQIAVLEELKVGLSSAMDSSIQHAVSSVLTGLSSIGKIVDAETADWREKIVKAFDVGKIKVPFMAEQSAEMIFNEIQTYFQDNEINLYFNKEELIKDIKEAVAEAGISEGFIGGGGTVKINPEDIAHAVASGLQGFFTGNFKSVIGEKKTVAEPKTEGSGKTFFLDPRNDYNRQVAELLREVVKQAQKSGAANQRIKSFIEPKLVGTEFWNEATKSANLEAMASASSDSLVDVLTHIVEKFGETIVTDMDNLVKGGSNTLMKKFRKEINELVSINNFTQKHTVVKDKEDKKAEAFEGYIKQSKVAVGISSLMKLPDYKSKHPDKFKMPEMGDMDQLISDVEELTDNKKLTEIYEQVDKQKELIDQLEESFINSMPQGEIKAQIAAYKERAKNTTDQNQLASINVKIYELEEAQKNQIEAEIKAKKEALGRAKTAGNKTQINSLETELAKLERDQRSFSDSRQKLKIAKGSLESLLRRQSGIEGNVKKYAPLLQSLQHLKSILGNEELTDEDRISDFLSYIKKNSGKDKLLSTNFNDLYSELAKYKWGATVEGDKRETDIKTPYDLMKMLRRTKGDASKIINPHLYNAPESLKDYKDVEPDRTDILLRDTTVDEYRSRDIVATELDRAKQLQSEAEAAKAEAEALLREARDNADQAAIVAQQTKVDESQAAIDAQKKRIEKLEKEQKSLGSTSKEYETKSYTDILDAHGLERAAAQPNERKKLQDEIAEQQKEQEKNNLELIKIESDIADTTKKVSAQKMSGAKRRLKNRTEALKVAKAEHDNAVREQAVADEEYSRVKEEAKAIESTNFKRIDEANANLAKYQEWANKPQEHREDIGKEMYADQITNFEHYRNEAQEQLDAANAGIAKHTEFIEDFEEINKQLYEEYNKVAKSGWSDAQKQERMSQIVQEISETKKEIEKSKKSIRDFLKDKAKSESEVQTYQDRLDRIAAKQRGEDEAAFESDLKAYLHGGKKEYDVTTKEGRLTMAQKRRDALGADPRKDITQRTEDARARATAAAEASAKAAEKRANAEEELAKVQNDEAIKAAQEVEALQAKAEAIKQSNSGIQDVINEKTKELAKYPEDKRSLAKKLEDNEEDVNQLSKDVASLQQRIEKAESDALALDKAVDSKEYKAPTTERNNASDVTEIRNKSAINKYIQRVLRGQFDKPLEHDYKDIDDSLSDVEKKEIERRRKSENDNLARFADNSGISRTVDLLRKKTIELQKLEEFSQIIDSEMHRIYELPYDERNKSIKQLFSRFGSLFKSFTEDDFWKLVGSNPEDYKDIIPDAVKKVAEIKALSPEKARDAIHELFEKFGSGFEVTEQDLWKLVSSNPSDYEHIIPDAVEKVKFIKSLTADESNRAIKTLFKLFGEKFNFSEDDFASLIESPEERNDMVASMMSSKSEYVSNLRAKLGTKASENDSFVKANEEALKARLQNEINDFYTQVTEKLEVVKRGEASDATQETREAAAFAVKEIEGIFALIDENKRQYNNLTQEDLVLSAEQAAIDQERSDPDSGYRYRYKSFVNKNADDAKRDLNNTESQIKTSERYNLLLERRVELLQQISEANAANKATGELEASFREVDDALAKYKAITLSAQEYLRLKREEQKLIQQINNPVVNRPTGKLTNQEKQKILDEEKKKRDAARKSLESNAKDLAKYAPFKEQIQHSLVKSYFEEDSEKALEYKSIITEISKLEQDRRLAIAKNESTTEIDKSLNEKHKQLQTFMYDGLTGQQEALRKQLTENVKARDAAEKELEKLKKDGASEDAIKQQTKQFNELNAAVTKTKDSLELVNLFLVDHEVARNVAEQTAIGGSLYKADEEVVARYIEGLKEIIRLEQQRADIKATKYDSASNNTISWSKANSEATKQLGEAKNSGKELTEIITALIADIKNIKDETSPERLIKQIALQKALSEAMDANKKNLTPTTDKDGKTTYSYEQLAKLLGIGEDYKLGLTQGLFNAMRRKNKDSELDNLDKLIRQKRATLTSRTDADLEEAERREYDKTPRARGLRYLSESQKKMEESIAQRYAIRERIRRTQRELEDTQNDDLYYRSGRYKRHQDILKSQMVSEYRYSEQYTKDRATGIEGAIQEAIDTIKDTIRNSVTSEFESSPEKRANRAIDDPNVQRQIDEEVKKRLARVEHQLRSSVGRDGEPLDAEKLEDAYASFKEERLDEIKSTIGTGYQESQEYQKVVQEREAAIREAVEAEIKGIDATIEFIKTATPEDSEELRNEMSKYMTQADVGGIQKEVGIILEKVNKRTNKSKLRKDIADAARRLGASAQEVDDLLNYISDNMSNIQHGKKRDVVANVGAVFNTNEDVAIGKARTSLSETLLQKAMGIRNLQASGKYQLGAEVEAEFNKRINEAIENYISQVLKNVDLGNGADGSFAAEIFQEAMKKSVYGLVGQFGDSLKVEGGKLLNPITGELIDIREHFVTQLTRMLEGGDVDLGDGKTIHHTGYLEQEKNIEANIAYNEEMRRRAMADAGIKSTEIIDAEILEMQGYFKAQLDEAKAYQKELSDFIAGEKAAGKTEADLKEVLTTLERVNTEVDELQYYIDNRDHLIGLLQEERANEKALKDKTPEELAMMYEAKRKYAEGQLNSVDARTREHAAERIAKYDAILEKLYSQIESKAEAEREANDPMNIIANKFADAIKKAMSGNGGLNVDATGLATEMTLNAIYEILVGVVQALGGKVTRDPAKDELLRELRALEAEKAKMLAGASAKTSDGKNSNGAQTQTADNKANNKTKREPTSKYADDFDFVKALDAQAKEVAKYQKGQKEYVLEQAKLYRLLWDYKNNTPELKKLKNDEFLARDEIKGLGLDPDLIKSDARTQAYKDAGGTDNLNAKANEFINGLKVPIEATTQETNKQLDNAKAATAESEKRVENEKKAAEAEAAPTKDTKGRKELSPEHDAFYESNLKYSPKDIIPEEAQTEAVKLKKTLDTMYTDGKAGTVDFMNTQVKLANLLSALRYKLGKGTAPKAEWESYVTGFLGNTENVLFGNVGKRDYKSKLKALHVDEPQVETKPAEKTEEIKIKDFEDFKSQVQNLVKVIGEQEGNAEAQRKSQEQLIDVLRAWAKTDPSKLGGIITDKHSMPNAKEWEDYLTKNKILESVDTKKTPLTGKQLNKSSTTKDEVATAKQKADAKKEEAKAATETANATKEQAAAEEKISEEKNEQKAVDTTEIDNKIAKTKRELGDYRGGNVDLSEMELGFAKEETLNAIFKLLEKIKTEGIKKGGSGTGKKRNLSDADEAALIKKRALLNHEAILGFGLDDKGNSKVSEYTSLVQQLDAAVAEVEKNTKNHKSNADAMRSVKNLAQRVSAMSFNILKESSIWDDKVRHADEVGTLTPTADATLRSQMEQFASDHANGKKYQFLDFDGTTLRYQLTDLEGYVENVTMEWNELNNQVAITSDKSTSKLDTLANKVETFGDKFKNSIDMGYLDANSEKYKAFLERVAAIDKETTFDGIEAARNRAIQAADEVTKEINNNKKLYTGTTEMNAVMKQHERFESGENKILDNTDLKIVKDYMASYERLKKLHDDLKGVKDERGLLNKEAQQELLKYSLETKRLGKDLEKAATQADRLKQLREDSGTYKTKDGQIHEIGKEFRLDGTIDKYAAMRKALEDLGATNIKVDKIHQRATGTIRHNNRLVSDLEVAYDGLHDSLSRYHKQERESLTGVPAFLNGFKKKFNSIMQYLSMTMSIHRIISEVRKGIQYVREIDDALVELRKVTDETAETYDKFLKTAAKTGEKLGATISDVTRATSTFAKLGYAISDASDMAEAALVYKNVGDNISSAEDAADSIISTLKGFKKENLDAMSIVDRFNEVGNRFAITSQGIGEALKLSASALSEGGNTLDESIGIITAANEVVNDPSSVGTALKTLTLRLRGSKTELEEMGEDVSDMATTTSQLQAKLLALTGGKVDIMLDANTFKSSTQILREMSEAWESMTDIQKASALELMGGKRQANVLSALIQNFDTAERAIEASANSAGK